MGAGAGEPREFAPERRTGERRKYNRRQSDAAPTPPYYEAFDRIAGALESIEQLLRELVQRGAGTTGAGWPDEARQHGAGRGGDVGPDDERG